MMPRESCTCLLYTSDAADDLTRVDLGGRRIIKKNFFKQKTAYEITTRLVGSEMCIRDRVIIRTVFERSDKETASGKMRFIPSFKIVRRAIPAYSELTQIAPELSSMRYCR